MDIFPSLKSSIAMGVVIAGVLVGYEVISHSDTTRSLFTQHTSTDFPNGEPSVALKDAVIFDLGSGISMHRKLGDLDVAVKKRGSEVSWEPTNDTTFIMRVETYDPLSSRTNVFGIEFEKLDKANMPSGYQQEPNDWVYPNRMMVNGEVVDYRYGLLFIYNNY